MSLVDEMHNKTEGSIISVDSGYLDHDDNNNKNIIVAHIVYYVLKHFTGCKLVLLTMGLSYK